MRQRLVALMTAFAATVALSTPAHSWDDLGHMTVAYLAYQQLTPATRTRVKALLKLNPYYKRKWTGMVPKGTSARHRDQAIFMIAATWPDQIKSDQTYHSDGSDNGNRPPNDATAKQNIGYTDRARHKYWHFIDTPFSQDATTLPPIPDANAEERIGLFRTVLGANEKDTLKSYDLSWLLHLVGDVHQPLHCATRVSATQPQGDAGGNKVTLTCCGNELHAFWDDVLGTSKTVSSAITVAKTLPAPDATLAAKSDATDWVAESFDAAKETAYESPPIGPGDGPFQLTASYKMAAKKVAQERVALAGARLANLLNMELK